MRWTWFFPSITAFWQAPRKGTDPWMTKSLSPDWLLTLHRSPPHPPLLFLMKCLQLRPDTSSWMRAKMVLRVYVSVLCFFTTRRKHLVLTVHTVFFSCSLHKHPHALFSRGHADVWHQQQHSESNQPQLCNPRLNKDLVVPYQQPLKWFNLLW